MRIGLARLMKIETRSRLVFFSIDPVFYAFALLEKLYSLLMYGLMPKISDASV